MNYTPTVETVLRKLERPGAFFTSEEVRAILSVNEQLRLVLDIGGEALYAKWQAAEAVVEQQTAALLRYGTHEPGCAHLEGYGSGCSCGLAAALRAGAEPGGDEA